MPAREILDGAKFGEWEVLRYAGNKKQLCRCSCGAIQEVSTYSLKSGASTHCKDVTKHIGNGEKAFQDLTNKKFGELKVIKYLGDRKWECLCSCGKIQVRSSKNLHNNSKCDDCLNKAKHKPVTEKTETVKSPRGAKAMIGNKFDDLLVIEQIDTDKYLCQCKCGAFKKVRGYSLRHSVANNLGSYVCKHALHIGDTVGKLTVINRDLDTNICTCRCECDRIIEVDSKNIIGKRIKSCGCSKVPLYNKEQVLSTLIKMASTTGDKPFAEELADELGVGKTAAYSYIKNYELEEYINTRFSSLGEKEIADVFKGKAKVRIHDRKVLSGLELDIYLPDYNLAIEYNGTYWRSDLCKSRDYHQKKSLECFKKGIRLIHIFEHEWKNPNMRDKLTKLLLGAIGKSKTHYARKLNLVEVDNRTARRFEAENHLQGDINAQISVGLEDSQGNLLGLMSFGKPRYDTNCQYELLRLCYKSGITIVGGKERMFKYFIDKYKPSNIVSYCNISKFKGNSYIELGFKVLKMTEPNYVWVNANSSDIRTRYQTQKHKLLEQGLGDITETEDDIMSRLGYNKVYDSGNFKFIWSENM